MERLEQLIALLRREIDILHVEQQIRAQVKEQMDQNHREYYLREQLKAIQNELGEGEDLLGEAMEYRRKIEALHLDKEISEPLLKEVSRLSHMPPSSSESAVIRNYLDACLELPWNKKTHDRLDLKRVRARLDKDHYGLDKVKQRIIEQLAVQKLTQNKNSQVICLSGLPASARPRWPFRLPGRWAASLRALRWAASATRPKFAAIARPTSAPCRGASSTRFPRPAAKIP